MFAFSYSGILSHRNGQKPQDIQMTCVLVLVCQKVTEIIYLSLLLVTYELA
ncbi:hypothetical protein LCGC14_2622670 [marine sediment metagenome]|uniref:Uncharacterized protein n=1 Tax=marine sediment metagenome TaxID=412755 RepID=A0A0F9A2K5_9ZZZZ